MRIVDFDTGQYGEPCVLLLGYFDGVHIGHRKLIARAEEIARALCCETGIMTFYDSKRGGQIYLFEERVMLFEKAGLDFVYAAHYNDAFRATDGIAFLDRVCASLNVRAFVCGKDHVFGKDAACGERELHAFCRARGIALHCEPLVSCGGQKAAATQAKGLLDAGDMPALQELLGGPYFILGTVSTEGLRTAASCWKYMRTDMQGICTGRGSPCILILLSARSKNFPRRRSFPHNYTKIWR